MGNQQVLRIVLSLAILAAFFLPVSSAGSMGISLQVSAWNVLSESFQNLGEIGNLPSEFYILIGCFFVMFVAAVALLLISLLKRSLPVFTFIAFLVMVVLVIITFTKSPVSASETVHVFGSGFYIMLIASFLLLFTNVTENTVTA